MVVIPCGQVGVPVQSLVVTVLKLEVVSAGPNAKDCLHLGPSEETESCYLKPCHGKFSKY